MIMKLDMDDKEIIIPFNNNQDNPASPMNKKRRKNFKQLKK